MSPSVAALDKRDLAGSDDMMQSSRGFTTKRTVIRLLVSPEFQHVWCAYRIDCGVENKADELRCTGGFSKRGRRVLFVLAM